MLPVHTAHRVRELDTRLIEGSGMPGRVLMEIAGRDAATFIHDTWPGAVVGVLCGPGNNGGDGYVVARWLKLLGHEVRIWAARPPTTEDARANQKLCVAMGLENLPLTRACGGAAVLVDALLGTGQRSAPRGTVLEGVDALRIVQGKGVPVVALDVPTGVSADTGQILGGPTQAVAATHTVTFGAWKSGLLCMPGAALAGTIRLVDLGFSLGERGGDAPPAGWLLEAEDVGPMLPRRTAGEAKWNRGHVAILGGGGAAVLAAQGALRAGAGLVSIAMPRQRWPELHGLWPEIMLVETTDLNPRRHDVLVMGPGLGLQAERIVRELWGRWPGPVVGDADALTILAKECPANSGGPRVITPHSAEAARLLQGRREGVEADRFSAMKGLSRFGTPVLKGPHTLIGHPSPWVLPVADGRLATAGSGDVLAGLIGGFLALGLGPREAAGLGGWLHAAAAAHMPDDGSASDLVAALRLARQALLR